MKKIIVSLAVLCIGKVVATPPPLPSFNLDVQRALVQPDSKSAEAVFENLAFYRLIDAIHNNVYFIKGNSTLDTYDPLDFFRRIYKDNGPVTTKVSALTNTRSLSTVPGFAQACADLIANVG